MEALRNTFARQAIPMTWDFAEGNPFSESSGNWNNNIEWTAMVCDILNPVAVGVARQLDATADLALSTGAEVVTDPPYYDNIGYADLSDFFYIWLRRSLYNVYPDVFGTLLVPKTQELIATPHRFEGGARQAKQFFEDGLGRAFARMRVAQSVDYPLTLYYAFKQAETGFEDNEDG
jgi:putative DNA methylase